MPNLSDLDHASPEVENGGELTVPGQHHTVLFEPVLPYLSLSGLIAMGQVCTSMREEVRTNNLLWQNLVVDDHLGPRMRDEILIEIASKGNGKLRTLELIDCSEISDRGLQSVVEKNPLIKKLYVRGRTALTREGVIKAVKTLSANGEELRSIDVSGIYNLQKKDFQELLSCIPANDRTLEQKCSEHFGWDGHYNDFPGDVSVCPRCKKKKKILVCPMGTCLRKGNRRECQGCASCIPRCIQCGACVELDDLKEAEAICEAILCIRCWLQLPKCDFCIKPYCKRHGERRLKPSVPQKLTCEFCYARAEMVPFSIN